MPALAPAARKWVRLATPVLGLSLLFACASSEPLRTPAGPQLSQPFVPHLEAEPRLTLSLPAAHEAKIFESFRLDQDNPASAPAPDTEPWDEDEWQFEVEPYGWLPAIKLRTQDPGIDVRIHQSDVLEDLKGVFFLYAEARYKRWGLLTEISYSELHSREHLPVGSLSENIENGSYQLGGYYRLGDARTTFDVSGAGRFYSLFTKFRRDGLTAARLREHWWELVLGGRFIHRFDEVWSLRVGGEFGGFGIGDAPDLSYRFQGTVRQQVTDSISLGLGYRYSWLDYTKGSLDFWQRMHGPVAMMTIAF